MDGISDFDENQWEMDSKEDLSRPSGEQVYCCCFCARPPFAPELETGITLVSIVIVVLVRFVLGPDGDIWLVGVDASSGFKWLQEKFLDQVGKRKRRNKKFRARTDWRGKKKRICGCRLCC